MVADVNLDGANASVRIYKLREHNGGSSFNFVSEFKQEYLEKVVRHYGLMYMCGYVYQCQSTKTSSSTRTAPAHGLPEQEAGQARVLLPHPDSAA
ncbi:hypothetical protein ACJX0J_041794, partial [Zea mays]